VVNFFDTGDADKPGTLSVLPPPDSNQTTFAGCQYTPPPGNSTGPPWGTYSNTQPNCSQAGISSSNNYQGQSESRKVPIPGNYTCNVSSSSGCWVRLELAFPSGVADTTTWTATLAGNPVRLVQ